MRYLLDSHTFLWFIANPDMLSKQALSLISNDENELYFSIASLWEIAIKYNNGKLELKSGYVSLYDKLIEADIKILPISFYHTEMQSKLPLFHRDPFDRMLVSQALIERMDIISNDGILDKYFINERIIRIW
jgi:PIN domain nuclease of toxin-antitoxin system